jgi:hypothetical protein
MSFAAAGEILGDTARVRTLCIAHHPELPDGATRRSHTGRVAGPCIDPNSPDLVPPGGRLAVFSAVLDVPCLENLRSQYTRLRAAIPIPTGAQRQVQRSGGGGVLQRNQPCPCGSGRKFKVCCGRSG